MASIIHARARPDRGAGAAGAAHVPGASSRRPSVDVFAGPWLRWRMFRWVLIAVLLSLAGLACTSPPVAPKASQAKGSLASLAWLSGSWVGSADDGTTEEVWTEPRGGMLLGVNRTVRDEATVHF